MKLQVPFVQLPLQFDAQRMAGEMNALGADAWREHPSKYPGNSALPLIAVHGDPDSDAVSGPMRPTPYLERCPYIIEVLTHIGAVWGRSRLMRLAGGAEVSPHVDINYYWREHLRVHVPITTQPGVRFQCGDKEVNMGPGECWIFDTWRPHRVINVPGHERVHLVADTVGGERFWEIANRGRVPGQLSTQEWRIEAFGDRNSRALIHELDLECVNAPIVMSPWELREHLLFILDSAVPDPRVSVLQQACLRFVADWRALWAIHGDTEEGAIAYRKVLENFDAAIEHLGGTLRLTNGMPLVSTMRSMVLKMALSAREFMSDDDGADASSMVSVATPPRLSRCIKDPIFIVSPPRSGSSLLFETLARGPDVYTIGDESHRLIEVDVAGGSLGTIARGYSSNRLDGTDATPEIASELIERYYRSVFDRDRRSPDGGPIRLLEKTPKNALRVPFLLKIFPDARFVYLYRDPREVMASMLEAWESGRFCTYADLPGWEGLPWSMVLIPGWRELIGKPLPEIVAVQWEVTTRILLDDLDEIPSEQRVAIRYDHLITNPDGEIQRLCEKLSVRWDRSLDKNLPHSRYTVSAPRPQKWHAREREIQPLLARLEATRERAERVFERDGC
jgi:hypothetical protein